MLISREEIDMTPVNGQNLIQIQNFIFTSAENPQICENIVNVSMTKFYLEIKECN